MDILRHLRFFTAVADARHFGDAARDLGMTQPPLSQGVRRLESRLGVRLFDRDARGVRITAIGQSLLPSARELLDRECAFVASASELSVPTQLRLGVVGDLDDLIPTLVAELAGSGQSVAPVVAGSVQLVDLLRDGMLDIAVLRHPGVVDGLAAGEVLVIPTRLDSTIGSSLKDAAPVAVPPRHHQPPAHDQLVDALRRLGHSGRVVEAADAVQRGALTAAGTAVRLVPVPNGAVGDPGSPPLRLRIARPLAAGRRPEVDHEGAAAVLHRVLSRVE